VAHRVKEECARSAGGIKHALFKRGSDRCLDDLRREPVGRIIFAEPMSLGAVDQGFIEYLENVALNLREAKSAHMSHNPAHKLLAFRVINDPVEKITFNRAIDSGGGEGFAR